MYFVVNRFRFTTLWKVLTDVHQNLCAYYIVSIGKSGAIYNKFLIFLSRLSQVLVCWFAGLGDVSTSLGGLKVDVMCGSIVANEQCRAYGI